MKLNCNVTQEKLACGVPLDVENQRHFIECTHCQNIFSDYQTLLALFEKNDISIFVPDNFSDKVMASIEAITFKDDWFENLLSKFNKVLEVPLVQYASIATGFGFGIISFIRFVAFVFIPA